MKTFTGFYTRLSPDVINVKPKRLRWGGQSL